MKVSNVIYHDLLINSSINKIFDAVSQPIHLTNWWPLKCTGNPIKDEEYNFYFTPEYDWYGKVIECEAPKKFHIQMTKADADWNFTSFGFDLLETTEGVQVAFWHKGWPHCNAHFKRSSYCWAILLNGLKNYVENDSIIPFEQRG